MASQKVEYRSVWEEGVVSTYAQLNLNTGEVTDIETSDEGENYEHLVEEFIYNLNNERQFALVSWNAGNRAFVDLDEWRA